MATEIKKICQEMMVKCNKKPRKRLSDELFPLVMIMNVKEMLILIKFIFYMKFVPYNITI